MKPATKFIAILSIATLFLAGCSDDTDSSPGPAPAKTTEDPTETDTRPAGVSVIEDQLNVDQWAERIEDETILETNDDGIPVHAADNEYDVLLTDGVLEAGYSYIAAIEDARYACYLLTAAIGNAGELGADIHEGITAAQHLAQLGRVNNSEYPDVQEYPDDDKPNAHTKAAVIHLCPDTVEHFDDELFNTSPFSEAIAEIGN